MHLGDIHMNSEIIEALLILADKHYNKSISQMVIDTMIPAILYCHDGTKWGGTFEEYLEHMGVNYCTSRETIEKNVGKLPDDITKGDAYYALAMVYSDYGLAIHGDKLVAEKLAYGYLTDPDK